MNEISIAEVAVDRGLVGGPFGSSLVSKDYVDSGVPVIRGQNMSGRYISGEFAYVTDAKKLADLARNIAVPGDLVFTQRGTLGQVSMVPNGEYEEYVVSQSQMRLRVDETVAHAAFVYYATLAPDFVRQIANNAIATGVPHINLGILSKLTIPGFPLDRQRAISEVLGALDDKIAANTQVISRADQLAETMWLDAVSTGEPVPLSTLARFVNGRAFTKGASGTGRVVVRIAELNSGIGASTVRSDIDVPDDHLARPGDLLFAWSGSLTVARWFREEAIINQHIFKVIPADGMPVWVLNGALRAILPYFRAVAADKATTMGHIQRRHLDETVRIPSAARRQELDDLMSGLWGTALSFERQNLALAAARDELLPLLMSGKLRVKDAEQIVEEIA
ncbi:restriction endonuclease subunit S [Nocardia cyriacigeorgica]|uniref:Type I restriction modification DNA specificity domain n=1 Tax=Nocardia cyriacigeorgica TaxID=135487 RepID=A0A4U8VVM1_9NOCA|nr:restriction endonuclease subunit S [Nocardia cyriacigeorgica]VFA96625.1 Type I restriction modification DNA specificity domain [Nocardia cyriacigeorgica]